jgi:hypothetical protein
MADTPSPSPARAARHGEAAHHTTPPCAPVQLEPRHGGSHTRGRHSGADALAAHHVHVLQHHAGAFLSSYAHLGKKWGLGCSRGSRGSCDSAGRAAPPPGTPSRRPARRPAVAPPPTAIWRTLSPAGPSGDSSTRHCRMSPLTAPAKVTIAVMGGPLPPPPKPGARLPATLPLPLGAGRVSFTCFCLRAPACTLRRCRWWARGA